LTKDKTCFIISAYTKKEHTMRDAILAKLAEVEEMLLEATLDGEQLAELDCFAEVTTAMDTLVQAVDYYVD
jgi:alkylhydroperoxidase family enzyme